MGWFSKSKTPKLSAEQQELQYLVQEVARFLKLVDDTKREREEYAEELGQLRHQLAQKGPGYEEKLRAFQRELEEFAEARARSGMLASVSFPWDHLESIEDEVKRKEAEEQKLFHDLIVLEEALAHCDKNLVEWQEKLVRLREKESAILRSMK